MRRKIAAVTVLMIFSGLTLSCSSMIERFKAAIEEATSGPVSVKYRERSPRKVKKVLPNGLTVLVQENFGAPVAAVQVWVNAGSGDETDSQAGIAHVLEHMVFKGTTNRAVGEVAREVEAMGGDLNAFTSYDQTVYHVTIASRYYDRAVDILTDLVRNAVIDPGELAREKEVVLEEIRRGMDNPRSRIYKYLFSEAYKQHTYRRPVIGYEDTVSSFNREDVYGFYRNWYVPRNMTVVVAGNVDADEVVKTVRACFSDMEDVVLPEGENMARSAAEPPQRSARAEIYYEDVSDGYMYMGFHIPPFAAEDMPALDVLSVILGGGETSRLVYRVRTERRLVNKIWAYAYTPRNPGMFLVGCNLSEDKAGEAMDMILKQLLVLKHEPVEDWELEKAKLTLETEVIYSSETVDGQARRLGHFFTLTGDPEYEKVYLEKVRSVTREDILKIAAKYFAGRNLTTVAIMPEKSREESRTKRFDQSRAYWIVQDVEGWDLAFTEGSLTETEPITPPEIPEAASTPIREGAPPVAEDPVKYVLGNGIRLIVRENHTVPLVSVRAAFAGGLRRESPDLNGINNFIAETITEGTVNHTASEIHSMIEARAGSIDGFSGRNSVGVTLEVPSQYFRSCLPVFSEVVRFPTFAEEETERMRGIIISNIRSQMDQPAYLAFRLFRSELFHHHPFGMEILGSEKSIRGITREDLMNYYQGFAVPENLVIAVVGDINAERTREEFERIFKDWVTEGYSPEPVETEAAPDSAREAVECRDVQQANIVIGFQGTRVSSDDRHAIAVMNSVLSGMSGRLFTELRDQQSLAYSVYAFSEAGVDPGYLGVYIGTAPEKETQAIEGIMEQLERIRTQPISEIELARAKQVLIGDFEIRLQRFASQAANYSLDELYGLGFRSSDHYAEKIQAVTVQDVQQAANEYIDPDKRVVAMVKPCEPQASVK